MLRRKCRQALVGTTSGRIRIETTQLKALPGLWGVVVQCRQPLVREPCDRRGRGAGRSRAGKYALERGGQEVRGAHSQTLGESDRSRGSVAAVSALSDRANEGRGSDMGREEVKGGRITGQMKGGLVAGGCCR